MIYVIRHPRWGWYAGPKLTAAFRRKKRLHEILEFATFAEAQAVLKDRQAYPGLEECVIEPKG